MPVRGSGSADELAAILAAVQQAHSTEAIAGLATVVRVLGSSYRQPGARMAFDARGWLTGSVSGGCLESDVILQGQEVIRSGVARLVSYDTRTDLDIVMGTGLGCEGLVEILIQPLPAGDSTLPHALCYPGLTRSRAVLATVLQRSGEAPLRVGEFWLFPARSDAASQVEQTSGSRPGGAAAGTWATSGLEGLSGMSAAQGLAVAGIEAVLQADAAAVLAGGNHAWRTYAVPGGEVELFLEVLRPPQALTVFGAGHDVIPLVEMAAALGWHTNVVDHRPEYATAGRFPRANRVAVHRAREGLQPVLLPGAAAILITHHYESDRALLPQLLTADVPYIALLGPVRRAERLLQDLRDEGRQFSPAQLARLHAPAGLDIGAEGPAQVALSILSEIQAVLSGRGGGTLRDSSVDV